MDPAVIVGSFGITSGMKIADFGSGSGHFTMALARLVGDSGRVTAVDILETALDSVRAQAKTAGLNNVDTVRANLELVGGTKLNNDSQDVVLVKNVLFQSPDKLGIIREANRVLHENGKLILIDWSKGSGGLGPPEDLRVDSEVAKSLALTAGFAVETFLTIDKFHFGFIFKKTISG